MLNVKRFTFVYFTLLYVLFRLTSLHFLFFLIAALVYIGIMVYGSFHIGSNFYMKPICSLKTNEKKVAITFDDGPEENNTHQILAVLEKFGIKAAFFCIGEQVSKNPDLVRTIDAMNHIVGNHSYSHSKWFDFYSKKKMKEELQRTEQVIEQTIGKKTKLFRPPFGVTNPALAKTVKDMNYIPVGWSIRSLDTRSSKRYRRIINRIVRKLKPGSIILLHDKHPDIALILENTLEYIMKSGYEIVRLDHLINQKAYA